MKEIIARIKNAFDKGDHQRQIEFLADLGDFYANQSDHIAAIAVYNFSIAIFNDNQNAINSEILDFLLHNLLTKTKNTETNFLKSINCKLTYPTSLTYDRINKQALHEIRESAKLKLKTLQISKNTLRHLFRARVSKIEGENLADKILDWCDTSIEKIDETISSEMIGFAADLIKQCIETIGPPPCLYSFICFGSLARGEATPYSDLEFAILVESEDEQYKQYFRNLTRLLFIQILNLGETTPRMANIKPLYWLLGRYDKSPTKNGFTFDSQMLGDRVTPLGNREFDDVAPYKKFELIHTPECMASFQCEQSQSFDLFLANILKTSRLVCGNAGLFQKYEQELSRINAKNRYPNTLLKVDARKFKLQLEAKKNELFLDIKHDLYRPFVALTDDLCGPTYHKSTFFKIVQLHEKQIINRDLFSAMRYAFTRINEIRLEKYLTSGEKSNVVNKKELLLILEILAKFYDENKLSKLFERDNIYKYLAIHSSEYFRTTYFSPLSKNHVSPAYKYADSMDRTTLK